MAENRTRGESGNGGESLERQRTRLARILEANGHGECAYDLEAADDECVVGVAYSIVEHLEQGCGAPRESDQRIAEDLRDWIVAFELDRS